MSLYPNSNHVEPLDVKPEAQPPGEGAAQSEPSPSEGRQPVAGQPDTGELVQVPANIAELRKGQMYDPATTFAQEIKSIEAPEYPREQVEAATVELRRMAGDVGLSSMQVREIGGLAKAHSKELPSDEQQAAWRDESTAALSRQYGSRAHEALGLAQKLAQRDPRVLAFIDAHGLGNHPRVIATLVERAYDERKRGRL